MSKKNQNYTNRKQNRFQPERMRGNVFVNNSGKQWLPGENGRAAKVERLLRGTKEEKKEIAGNMAGYKDSGIEWIGAIPKEWSVNKGKYIFNQVKKKPVYDTDEIITCFRDGEVTLRKNRRTDGFTMSDKEIGYQGIDKGDLIIHGMDGFAGAIGISDSRGKASPVLMVLDTKQIKSYMKYHLRAMASSGAIAALTTGIRVRSCDLRFSKLENILFAIPPLSEQQRIADFLDTKCGILDRTIDAVSRQIEDLEKYKKALITKTVTKGICKKGEPERAMKNSGVEWIGEVPEEWDVKRLKYVLDSIRNGAPAAAVEYSPELPRYIRITDIDDNGRLKETGKQSLPEDIAKRYMLNKEAVLIASVGSLGKTMLFNPDTEKEKCAFAGYLIEAVTNPEAMNSKFLFYFIKSNAYMDWANRNFVQTTIQNLSAGRHKNLPVTVPPLAEQQQIADYLDEKCKNIDNRVQKRRQQLEWLKEYKKSLIFDYVTGKKRVEKE